ncbi:hypothetical protein F441_20918, partial [Phytophthora nicotianae CJ01A1]
MSSFVLSPPNSSALSDTVIGAVMQRSTWKTRGKTYDRVDNNATVPNTSHQQSNHRTYLHAPYHKPSQNYPSATMSKVPAEASKNA